VSQINFTHNSLHIKSLIEAARKGFVPAQAVVTRVLSSYNISWTDVLTPVEVDEWLFRGASTGSVLAYDELKIINRSSAEEALQVSERTVGSVTLILRPALVYYIKQLRSGIPVLSLNN